MSEEISSQAGGGPNFRQQFQEFWTGLPAKPLFFAALAVWLLFFHFLGNSTLGYVQTHSLFGWMHFVYSTSPDDGHCYFIPVVVLGLLWWKREKLLEIKKEKWWPGFSLVVLALILHLMGYMVQQTRISILAFFVGLFGITGLVWGKTWLKATFFPFFLFIFCIPLGTLSDGLTFPLRMLVSVISSGIGKYVLGIDLIREGTQIYNAHRTFEYDVAAACSGIRSLTVLLALTTIYGFIHFKSGWKRFLMVFVAFPLALLGNIIRITGVIITAEIFGEQAGLKFHDGAGFVTFSIAIGCVMALGSWLKEKEPEKPTLGGQIA